MPSGPLLYNDTLAFRSTFFERYNVPQIIDFTFLRNTLFENANIAVASLFVQKRIPDEADILHITLKRTRANKEKNYFEIDHYDFHDVPKQVAKSIEFVWKSNLVGGGRIYHLIDRFTGNSVETLRDFLQKKKEENNWDFGQGYITGIKNKKFPAEYITGKESVIDKFFTEDGILKTEIQKEVLFKDKSKQIIFEPPHLLIKKTIGKKAIPVELRYDYLTFRNEIIGIHCTQSDVGELEKFAESIKNNNQFYRFYITATSARFGVGRTPYTILLEDIEELPKLEEVQLTFAEKILVDDVVEYSIDHFAYGENAKINKKASKTDLCEFSDIYIKAINSIYQENNKQYSLSKVYEGNAFYACEYIFGDKTTAPEYRDNETDFSDLINHWTSRNALIKRVLRIYSDNKIILVKPKQLRYWLRSIALRDVDETLNESFDLNA